MNTEHTTTRALAWWNSLSDWDKQGWREVMRPRDIGAHAPTIDDMHVAYLAGERERAADAAEREARR